MKVVLRPSFDIPVILLNQVIQIVVLPDGDDFFIGFVGVECSQRCRVGTTLPQVRRGVEWPCERSATPLQHPVWRSAGRRWSGLQYPPRGTDIFDFDVGFVHSPSMPHRTFMLAKCFIQQRHQTDDPTVQRGVVNNNSTLCHNIFELAKLRA
ncbi:Uncharacterised protein [Yersinia similis]|nr:Uncharacterised protein [Yersinia similis]CNB52461.1 Uncharacterised protein [Yersinia similis]